tara:strand:+ start:2558 stop:4234 length:1677 start_codon:yes stop_codon:yes gene_type:complete
MFGDNRTSKMFNQFRKDTRSSSHAINNLRNQIIAAFSVRELVTAGDTFVNLQNRMGALTGNATDTADAMAHMKRIAIESRSDFSAVGDLFAKITFATKEMGLSQQEVADATQTVANTFIISGASAIEAANASRQLAQGLASGTLRGDELNSVMEQNSALAELLAKGLGVSTGQLREMGAAGKITAENILPTLISATDETNKTIADMNMTIGQSISLLKTQFTTLIGEFEKATGVFGTTASAIGMLAKNMELLLIPATALAVSAIPKLVSGIVALGVAVRANPLTTFATGLASLVALLKMTEKEVGSIDERIADLFDTQQKLIEQLDGLDPASKKYAKIIRMIQVTTDTIEELQIEQIKLNESIDQTPESMSNFLSEYNKIIEKSKEGIQVVKTFGETIEGKLTNAFTDFFDIASEGFGNFKNLATSIIRAIVAELVQLLIVQKAVGMIKSSIDAFAFGATAKPGQLLNLGNVGYEGGGYTGMGVRSGGIDGRGGFPAILHPNETVIDHTKGQSMGATVNFNITTVDATGFDELLASRKNMIISMINQAYNSRGKMGIA